MVTLHHQVWIDAPIDQVYGSISSAAGISEWWDEQTEKSVDGDLIWEHCPPPSEGKSPVGLRVVLREPNRRVVLECAYAPADGSAAHDWAGTTLTFELVERKEHDAANRAWMTTMPAQTILNFRHSGWAENAEYMAFCNSAWGTVLAKLKSTCETYH